jgi:hypothetical protein
MVSLKSILKVCAPLLALSLASSAFADAPPYVRVRNISYAGSGCPAGSVAGNTSPDRQAFTLLFDSYIAEVGPGVPLSLKRRNCQLNIDLDFPSGWSYTIFTVDYRGYVALERGVKGTQQSSYYFQGQGRTATLKTIMNGPIDQNYQIRDTLGLDAMRRATGAQHQQPADSRQRACAARFGSPDDRLDRRRAQARLRHPVAALPLSGKSAGRTARPPSISRGAVFLRRSQNTVFFRNLRFFR